MTYWLRGTLGSLDCCKQRDQLIPGDYLRVRQTRIVGVGEVGGVQVEIWSHAEGLKLVALDFQAAG